MKLSRLALAVGAAFWMGITALQAAEVPWQGMTLTGTNRIDILSFYYAYYTPSENFKSHMAWTGNVAGGVAGTTGVTFKHDMLRRINFFRVLAGVGGNIAFNTTESTYDQAAALMFSANGNVSHSPPATWRFRTSAAVEAAGNSLLSYGLYGPPVIDDYMLDDGAGNEPVGHRRWLLYSRGTTMGTGDIATTASNFGSNALWVIGSFKPEPTAAQMRMSAWPTPGYFPFPLTPARWSFSYSDPDADFSQATVTMKKGNVAISASNLTVISKTDVGVGDRSIVWELRGLPSAINADTTYTVTVAGVRGPNSFTGATYPVTLFDPNVLNPSVPDNGVLISGSSQAPLTGGTYSIAQIPGATWYQLRVARAGWVGLLAGDVTPPAVSKTDSFLYVSHGNAIHMAFPGPEFENQVLGITKGGVAVRSEALAPGEYREFVPTATATLQFDDICRFTTTSTTLSAEISTDNGNRWTPVWMRSGVGLNSASWDTFNKRTISLSRYAGKSISLRFILRHNNGRTVLETKPDDGFYLDSILLKGCVELIQTQPRDLGLGNVSGFQFNATTAGEPLLRNTVYYLRVQPMVVNHQFGYGPLKVVRTLP